MYPTLAGRLGIKGRCGLLKCFECSPTKSRITSHYTLKQQIRRLHIQKNVLEGNPTSRADKAIVGFLSKEPLTSPRTRRSRDHRPSRIQPVQIEAS